MLRCVTVLGGQGRFIRCVEDRCKSASEKYWKAYSPNPFTQNFPANSLPWSSQQPGGLVDRDISWDSNGIECFAPGKNKRLEKVRRRSRILGALWFCSFGSKDISRCNWPAPPLILPWRRRSRMPWKWPWILRQNIPSNNRYETSSACAPR